MTDFTAYIERQKHIIREKHEGELILIHKGETVTLSKSDRLFEELTNSEGLNTSERLYFRRAV